LTLPENIRSQVNSAIDKNGLIKKGALDKIKSNDDNFVKLKGLANHKETTEFGTDSIGANGVEFHQRTVSEQREKDIQGYLKDNPGKTREEAERFYPVDSKRDPSLIYAYHGQTYTPNGESDSPRSPSGRLRAVATNRLGEGARISEEDAVVAMGHEIYNHAYKFRVGDRNWTRETGASVNRIEQTTRNNYRGQGNKPRR
jgi:hypothetical protein